MPDLPKWDELNEDEQFVAESMMKCIDRMAQFESEKVILFMAFMTDGLVSNLADRVLSARQMGLQSMLDPKTHLAGMALSASMTEYRQAYDVCFNEEQLAYTQVQLEKSLLVVDELQLLMNDVDANPEGVQNLLAKLEALREEG